MGECDDAAGPIVCAARLSPARSCPTSCVAEREHVCYRRYTCRTRPTHTSHEHIYIYIYIYIYVCVCVCVGVCVCVDLLTQSQTYDQIFTDETKMACEVLCKLDKKN